MIEEKKRGSGSNGGEITFHEPAPLIRVDKPAPGGLRQRKMPALRDAISMKRLERRVHYPRSGDLKTTKAHYYS